MGLGVRRHPSVGLKSQWTDPLQPVRLSVHGEARHFHGRLEGSVRHVATPLADDAVPGRNSSPPVGGTPTSSCFVNDLQVQDDATSFDLSGFDAAVQDAHRL